MRSNLEASWDHLIQRRLHGAYFIQFKFCYCNKLLKFVFQDQVLAERKRLGSCYYLEKC